MPQNLAAKEDDVALLNGVVTPVDPCFPPSLADLRFAVLRHLGAFGLGRSFSDCKDACCLMVKLSVC